MSPSTCISLFAQAPTAPSTTSRTEAADSPSQITGIRTFVDPTNPQRVGLLFDVPDMDALLAALPTPEFAKAEAADGVVAESIVLLVES